jgi:hypothetical protein
MMAAPNTGITVVGNLTATGSGAGVNGYNVRMNAGGAITMGGNIDTTGGAAAGGVGPDGGDVDFTSTGGNISVFDITTSGAAGADVGGNAGTIALTPALTCVDGPLGCIPDGRIILNGDLYGVGGAGTDPGQMAPIYLAASGRAVVPSIATVISSFSGNDVSITGGVLSVGPQESVSILGSLSVDVSRQIFLSDVVARDDITFSAPVLVFEAHGPEQVLQFDGTLGIIAAEHIISRTQNFGGVTTIVGDSANIGTTSLTQAQVQTIMQYAPESYLLDFDVSITPSPPSPPPPSPPSPPPSPHSLPEFIVLHMITGAQLTDELNDLNREIFDHNYFLGTQCYNETPQKACQFRNFLEYRGYTVQEQGKRQKRKKSDLR